MKSVRLASKYGALSPDELAKAKQAYKEAQALLTEGPGWSSVEKLATGLDAKKVTEVERVANDLANGRVALGDALGEGGFGRVVELPGYPDLAVKIAKANDGAVNAQLAKEAENLRMLAEKGYATPYRGVVSWIDESGVQRHAIVMERIEGSLSKEILRTGKFKDVVPSPEMLRLVNDKTLADLRAFRAKAAADNVVIDDLQFMISHSGSAHLIDPARVTTLGRGATAKAALKAYLKRIDKLIDDFAAVAAKSR